MMRSTTMNKCYSDLIKIPDLTDRFNYLKLSGLVGAKTFGFDRIFNQRFYKSEDWKRIRAIVIDRDQGNDMAHPDFPIAGKIIIHHMNPVSLEDIELATDILLDPEYLVCVSHMTHNAIHYGDENLLPKPVIERKPGDTCPWRK